MSFPSDFAAQGRSAGPGASALRAGDVRFHAELRASALREPVIKQKSTDMILPNGHPDQELFRSAARLEARFNPPEPPLQSAFRSGPS
jgi:hypothetical protein